MIGKSELGLNFCFWNLFEIVSKLCENRFYVQQQTKQVREKGNSVSEVM